ncbi:AraC family transcriptional regulator [Bacillus sp. 165]|uniref:AraC family transcriptional regulator n=1 Tax=Bacillus sp. 165 TaxID=1529117 RepID=UPI001ADBE1B7|nr:AraC family transcriptional regulator [Bacillus sp. 165]MBO9128680.1 helix-turn-helix transcriptional regulator [Bacillus sp. 165]
MKTLLFQIPPFPTFIKVGKGTFGKGKKHFRRIYTVFDFLYVQKGTLFMNEDGKEFEIREGEYIILSPGHEHFGYRPCEESTDYYWCHFLAHAPYFLTDEKEIQWNDVLVAEETFTEPAQFLMQIPQSGSLQNKDLGERMLEDLTSANDHALIENKLQQQLHFHKFLLFLQKEALAIPSAAEKVSEQAIAYILEHYREEMKITDIAERLHYHADYITRCMQKTMGMGPLQYLNEVRLASAKKYLSSTNEKIKKIAKQVGIHDETYFSRLFRKKEGMSPQEYRRMLQREGIRSPD